jgi:hypothetical protein
MNNSIKPDLEQRQRYVEEQLRTYEQEKLAIAKELEEMNRQKETEHNGPTTVTKEYTKWLAQDGNSKKPLEAFLLYLSHEFELVERLKW